MDAESGCKIIMKIPARAIQTPTVLLCLGIVTRCLVYVFLSPYNNDAHITIVEFLVRHKSFPNIADNYLAFHPPLYYLLAAPVLAIFGSDKAVQFLSLITSIGTLFILYRIIFKTAMMCNPCAKLYSFLIACFLPQFVMFGLYVSNDSLSFLLGSLITLEVAHYIDMPNKRSGAVLAVVTGLGLLTKTSFLPFVPVLMIFIFIVQVREHRAYAKAGWATCVFLVICTVLGSYKYIDNYVHYDNPLINSLDISVWSFQTRSFQGIRSYLDVDLPHLLAAPSIPFDEVMGNSRSITTTGSYPLLFYGTFWYQLIPESNFRGTAHKPFSYLGSLIYLVALVPTMAFALGAVKNLPRFPSFVRSFDRARIEDRGLMISYVSAALLLANTLLLLVALMKYHVWSVAQGRYLFPTFPGLLAIFAAGVVVLDTTKRGATILRSSMVILMVLFAVYFSSEIGYLILHAWSPGLKAFIERS
jgi:4-amino-4-deoxy-L-arabinose transferase-like glycosyltransferase